jgi:chromosomal replication initiator protein
MEKSNPEIWARALEEIKKQISPPSFEMWFRPTKAVLTPSDSVAIEVPNKLAKDWLIEHYYSLITDVLEKQLGIKTNIEFCVSIETDEHKEEPLRFKEPGVAQAQARSELRLNPKYTFESFVVGPSNRFAHAASLAVAESPARAYNPLFIYGGVGLGKTHLMQAISHHILERAPKLKVCYISSEEFTNQLINSIQNRTTLKFREKYRNVDLLLIDDIHFIAGKESTQEEFFHTFNTLYDAHKQIVISSDRLPKEISALEKRLISRFEWGLITDVQPPDLETRIAILKKKAERELVEIPNEVTFFIADKIKTNIRELEGALIRVVAYSTLEGKEITLKLAQDVLKDMVSEEEKKINVDLIQKRVAEYFDIRLLDMKTKDRKKGVAYPRQIAMYLVRHLTNYSLPEIGDFFGGRDHTTILYAYNKIQQDINKGLNTKKTINELIVRIKED